MNDDYLDAALSALPAHDIDARRAARIRANCHAALRRQARSQRLAIGPTFGHRTTWTVEAASILAVTVYLVEVVRTASRLIGP